MGTEPTWEKTVTVTEQRASLTSHTAQALVSSALDTSPSRQCGYQSHLFSGYASHYHLCCPLLLLSSIFSRSRVFSHESALPTRWSKHWSFSFSISPYNEYSGLILFRFDWTCWPRDSQEYYPTPQFKSVNSSAFSFLYGQALMSISDYWKNHSFD